MQLSASDRRERAQAVADAQATYRHSKRRAYFGERRHREDSLMYRDPVFAESAALTLPIQPAFLLPSRKVIYRPSWPNAVAVFPRYTPIADRGHLRMRLVGLAAYNGPVIDAFDIQTGELLYTADAHDRPVHFVHLISAGTAKLPVFASCCHGGTIKLIELQTGKILEKVKSAISGPCYGVCICEAKLSFLIAGCGRNVSIWRIPGGRPHASLEGHRGRVMCVVCHRSHPAHIDEFNPGFIASADDLGFIRTWLLEDPWTPLLEIEAHVGAILSMSLKKPMDNNDIDRYRLFTTGHDKTLRIFDAMTGECLGCVCNHTGPVQAHSFLSLQGPLLGSTIPGRWNEDIVLTAGLDKRINFWRVKDMSLIHCMQRDKPVRGVATTVVPHPMMVATAMDDGLEIIDLTMFEDLPDQLKHWARHHEEAVVRKREEDEGDIR